MKVSTNILNMDEAVVAFSGGPDSVALLHYLKYNTDIAIKAIHVNHNLQTESHKWAKFCLDFCAEHNIPAHVYDVFIEGNTGIENKAREARYSALKRFGDKIITGHHGDDQIETLFLKMFRGSGIGGLKGMDPVSTNNGLTLYRPLLQSNKEEILDYCDKHGLSYIIDPSNNQSEFDRNIVRNKIIPAITEDFPSAKVAIHRSIAALSDADKCLRDLAQIDLESVSEGGKISIKLIREKNMSPERIRNMLIYFLKNNSLTTNVNHLNFFSEKILTISYDGNLELLGSGVSKRKLKQRGKYLSLTEW